MLAWDRMEPKLRQLSIVVRAESHNPTILNPDFLAVQGIVPQAWGWETEQPVVVTPMLAVVRYVNGVSVQVQHESLQIAEVASMVDPTKSRIPEIARNYVHTLPHVRYTALGINFHSSISCESPERTIFDRFVKPGAWAKEHAPVGAGIRLLYPLPDAGRLILSIDGGQAQDRGEDEEVIAKPAILANANFHRDLHSHPARDEISRYLDGLDSDWTMYESILRDVFFTEA